MIQWCTLERSLVGAQCGWTMRIRSGSRVGWRPSRPAVAKGLDQDGQCGRRDRIRPRQHSEGTVNGTHYMRYGCGERNIRQLLGIRPGHPWKA